MGCHSPSETIKNEAASFRHNRIKNRGIVKTQYLYKTKYKFEESKVENLWFSSFFNVFYSIAVSSLSVPLYAYHSSADDFCSKSSEPQRCFALRIQIPFVKILKTIDSSEFLMTQPLLHYVDFQNFKYFKNLHFY